MTKTLTELRSERAGCVQLRRARFTGTVVGIYHNDDAGLDSDDGRAPYSTVCEDHSFIVSHETLTLARHHASTPDDWCEACQAINVDDRQQRRDYERGWRYSQRPTATLDHGDERNEPDAWYDGYLDYAAGRDKFHTLLCRAGVLGFTCEEHNWGQR